MAEYIEREEAIKAIMAVSGVHYPWRYAQIIKKIPAADVVEVVRCINCRHLDSQYYHGTGWCEYHDVTVELDNFCKDGEKKRVKEVEK